MLLRALLLQAFYGIRSMRLLMERLDCDLLFRWFVGLGVYDPVWNASFFSKNRDRLLGSRRSSRETSAIAPVTVLFQQPARQNGGVPPLRRRVRR
jgi:hypothetical protein